VKREGHSEPEGGPAPSAALFYYDLGSPYAYLAAERVEELLPSSLEWRPVLLGGLFKLTGRSSWAHTVHRRDGIAEVERRAAARGLPPLRWPEPWPGDGLLAMRAAVVAHRAGRGREFALQALRVHFRDGSTLSDREAVASALELAGLDPLPILDGAADPLVKQELRRATSQACALGVTGVPSIVVGGVVYWGDDRIEDAARAMRG
jgi:2-hydroxychromene-2-carboxylate isomerase